jgi:hypothetical protein
LSTWSSLAAAVAVAFLLIISEAVLAVVPAAF